MKSTILSPRDAAWLTETFARNSNRFGGWKMMADDPKPDPVVDPKTDPKAEGAGSKDAVLADLAKERKARQALEAQVAELSPLKDQMAALAEALGVKPDKGADDSTALKLVQDSLAQIQRENAVLALANEHGIKDADDLAILRGSSANADGLASLAKRLAPSEDDGKPGTPKPDATQGSKGDKPKPDSLPGVPRMAAAFDDAMNTN